MIQNIDENLPKKSFLTGVESNKTRPFVSVYIANIVNSVANTRNDKMTQGILVYECLMLSNNSFSDSLTEVEETINQSLIDIGVNPDAVDSYTNKEIGKSVSKFKKISDNIEALKEEKAKEKDKDYEAKDVDDTQRIRVWLPEYIKEQADFSRGWGSETDNAVTQAYISPYTDRYDRLDVKKDIIENKKSGNYRRDISRQIVNSVSEAVVKDWGEYEKSVGKNTDMETRLEYLHSISENMSMSHDGFVTMYQDIHNVNIKRAEDVILDLAKKYKILHLNSEVDELYVSIDNINKIAKRRSSDREEKITLFGNLLERIYQEGKFELDKDKITVNIDAYKNVLYNLNLVEDRKRLTTGNYIDDKYDIAKYHSASNTLVLYKE